MYFLYCHWNFAVHHNFQVMLDHVDANACMGFHNSGAHECLGFHLEMAGDIVFCSSAFFLVILPENIIKPSYLQITLVQLVTVNFLYIETPIAAREKEKFKPRYQFQLCWQVFCCFRCRACESCSMDYHKIHLALSLSLTLPTDFCSRRHVRLATVMIVLKNH